MGLSNAEKQQAVTTYQVLIELVNGLKTLGSGKEFANLVKDAYALPEKEQALAEEAKANIVAYNDAIAKNSALADSIDAQQAKLDKTLADKAVILQEIKDKNIELDRKQRALDAEASDIKKASDDLAAREQLLADGLAKLDADKAALKDERRLFAVEQEELKVKAEQIKKLVG